MQAPQTFEAPEKNPLDLAAELVREKGVILPVRRLFLHRQNKLSAVKAVRVVVERLQIAVGKGQKPDVHLALIALLALALQVHRHFGGDEGLEIVGGLQRLQLHVVVYHQQLVLQIGSGEGAALHLGDAAVFQVAAEQLLHHHADAALALAAVALEQHHGLSAVCRNQAIAEVFLQGQDVLRFQQVGQKPQPCLRLRRIGVIADRQTVAAEFFFGTKLTIEKQRAVGNVDAILLNGQLLRVGLQLQRFQKSGGAARRAARKMRAQHLVDLLADALFVRDAAFHGEKAAVHADHRVRRQKVLAEQNFVEVLVL